MPNTIVQTTLFGETNGRRIVRHINIVSDGSEETDLVIYDNSALIANVNAGVVEKIEVFGSAGLLTFEWDQTTDFAICSMDSATNACADFSAFGGIKNPGGAGATGDVVLTTANLDAGDVVTIILTVIQK